MKEILFTADLHLNINDVGADYGRFRGVIYDADTRLVRWVGEPVHDAA